MNELIQKCIELVINEYTAGDFYREVYEAKKEYFENLGTVTEEDPDFENQMDVFMGWYLFDRPLNKFDLSPVQLFFRKNIGNLSEEQRKVFPCLTEARHSIYELIKIKDSSFVLQDLNNKEKLEVIDSNYRGVFSKGDIFEARLVPVEKQFVFTNGFCMHPKEASKFIQSQMKKIRAADVTQRTKLLLKLGNMKNKHQRFPHINIDYIYTLEPKF